MKIFPGAFIIIDYHCALLAWESIDPEFHGVNGAFEPNQPMFVISAGFVDVRNVSWIFALQGTTIGWCFVPELNYEIIS